MALPDDLFNVSKVAEEVVYLGNGHLVIVGKAEEFTSIRRVHQRIRKSLLVLVVSRWTGGPEGVRVIVIKNAIDNIRLDAFIEKILTVD
jgi:hypothetical protein